VKFKLFSGSCEFMMHDKEAILRVLAGEREMFRSLVARHQSAVCATVRALASPGADWEDISQDVFLAAFQQQREMAKLIALTMMEQAKARESR
jgi:DNA-directed RNA polymerase specialized sigma24 family protein